MNEITRFYVLRDKCLGEDGLVSHVSLTSFGVLVSHTSCDYCAILFTYEHAVLFRDFIMQHDTDCFGYDIISFDDV